MRISFVAVLVGVTAATAAVTQAAVDAGGDSGCYPPANLLLSDDGGAPDAAVVLDAGPPSRACPGTQVLSGSINAAVSTAPLVGPMPADAFVYIDVGLPERNQDWAEKETEQLSDPMSPCYGQYLTEDQFVAAYSPSIADYGTAIAFVAANGLTVTQTFSNRLLFSASGTVADINQTFCVEMGYYLRPDGSQFYSADRAPSINLSVPILAVDGLDNYFVSEPVGPVIDLMPPAAGAPGAPGAGCSCTVVDSSPTSGLTVLVALFLSALLLLRRRGGRDECRLTVVVRRLGFRRCRLDWDGASRKSRTLELSAVPVASPRNAEGIPICVNGVQFPEPTRRPRRPTRCHLAVDDATPSRADP